MIKNNATYSEDTSTLTISVPDLETLLQQQPAYSQLNPPSLQDILEEGVCRDFWTMDYDREQGTDLVVIR